MHNHNGYMLRIDRLAEFLPRNYWQWNNGEIISLAAITQALHSKQIIEKQAFGDAWKGTCVNSKSTAWHIGRVLYFIKHSKEIKNLDIDNDCDGYCVYPRPVIVDGNHRFLAAMWLHAQGKLQKVHCFYCGRLDLLDYLTGVTDVVPIE